MFKINWVTDNMYPSKIVLNYGDGSIYNIESVDISCLYCGDMVNIDIELRDNHLHGCIKCKTGYTAFLNGATIMIDGYIDSHISEETHMNKRHMIAFMEW